MSDRMIEYTLYVHTDMVEVRKLQAPEGMSFTELEAYADAHGYGDMVDVVDDVSELQSAETSDGRRLERAE